MLLGDIGHEAGGKFARDFYRTVLLIGASTFQNLGVCSPFHYPFPFLSSPAPPFPLSLHSFPSVPFTPLPFFPLKVGPLKSSQGSGRSAVSAPSGVWGGAPAEIEFGAFQP